tara:strand:- start:1272 stop:1481 length:210 start_codon:yes stop_codon:yes gene_type:complete
MNKTTKITLITFGLFMTEAILHYNLGTKEADPDATKKGFLPPTNALIKIAAIVAVFSVINSVATNSIKK